MEQNSKKLLWKASPWVLPREYAADQVVRDVVEGASTLRYGELECLQAEHDRLLTIVSRLVARLPADEVAAVCGIDPDDLKPVP